MLSLSVFDPKEEICARLNAFQPERINSYASTLGWLADWALEGKLRIAPRSVLASGDRLTPAIRAQVKAAWNADIYDLYGACESLCMAVQAPGANEFRVLTESNLLEVVDSAHRMVQPGARGRVLLTSLVNATLPLIRYDLHDYAVLGRVVGLGAEILRSLDGKTYHALPVRLTDGRLDTLEVYELARLELPGIVAIQFVSHSPIDVEIRYQSACDLNAQIDAAFHRLLTQKHAAVEKVTVRRVEQIADSLPAFKLECVLEPDQATFAPVSLAEADRGSGAREPATQAAAEGFFDDPDLDGSIDRRFREIAAAHAEHPAALDEEREMTYAQLDRVTARVAGALLCYDFDPSLPVAVFCAHRLDLLPLILGVLRAGGFYLPLDPHMPPGRVQAILSETRPRWLLTTIELAKVARALAGNGTTVSCLEEMEAQPPKEAPLGSPAGPACLLHTSGSTAAPKCVLLSHRTIRARAARYAQDYGLGASDRIALLQSHAFNAGTRDIFGALLAGATLALYDVRARGVAGLGRWLKRSRVTVLYAVPTLFRSFLKTLESAESFPDVRVVRLGGEPMQPEDVSGFRRHFSRRCRLVNGYAATETDTICQLVVDHDTRIVAGRVPAGTPVPGVEVTLCDEQGAPVVGALGEIRVRSKLLAAGYWDAAQCCVQPFELPFATGDTGYRLADGRVFLFGRRDRVVKVHGHRLDLDEVERVASAVPGIVEAAAALRAAPARLVVFYVAAGDRSDAIAALRYAVSSVVPPRAVSMVLVPLSALPRLPGGKVNRANLPADLARPEASATEVPGYASDTEAALARIWREALGVPCTSRGDSFFGLGGDSITVFRALSLIEREFGVDVPVAEFFANVALHELARAIDARRSASVQGAMSRPLRARARIGSHIDRKKEVP